jgi:uncharacterized lipoprotein YmbA
MNAPDITEARLRRRDVRLARYLDRNGIVRAASGTRLVIEDGQHWAAPLDDMPRNGRVEASEAPFGFGTNAQVQALSETLARLADRMAEVFSS